MCLSFAVLTRGPRRRFPSRFGRTRVTCILLLHHRLAPEAWCPPYRSSIRQPPCREQDSSHLSYGHSRKSHPHGRYNPPVPPSCHVRLLSPCKHIDMIRINARAITECISSKSTWTAHARTWHRRYTPFLNFVGGLVAESILRVLQTLFASNVLPPRPPRRLRLRFTTTSSLPFHASCSCAFRALGFRSGPTRLTASAATAHNLLVNNEGVVSTVGLWPSIPPPPMFGVFDGRSNFPGNHTAHVFLLPSHS